MSATRARFAGWVPSINLDHRSAVPRRLVLELSDQFSPTYISNRTGEGWVLHHVLDREALDYDRLVLTNQVRRKLVLMMSSSIGDAGMDPGHAAALLLAVF